MTAGGHVTRHEGSMIRRRVLARQLRLMREGAGLTLEQAAPKLDFSVSRLSRIETAQVVIDVHWVKSMWCRRRASTAILPRPR